MILPEEHGPGDPRYRELLARLEDLSERVERLESDQRTLVALLRDFRELTHLLVARLRNLDQQVAGIAARLVPFHGRDERIARHFRN